MAAPRGEKAVAPPAGETTSDDPVVPSPSEDELDVKSGFGDHDRVAMVSLKADGTPDQTPGYEAAVDLGDEKDPRGLTPEGDKLKPKGS